MYRQEAGQGGEGGGGIKRLLRERSGAEWRQRRLKDERDPRLQFCLAESKIREADIMRPSPF